MPTDQENGQKCFHKIGGERWVMSGGNLCDATVVSIPHFSCPTPQHLMDIFSCLGHQGEETVVESEGGATYSPQDVEVGMG